MRNGQQRLRDVLLQVRCLMAAEKPARLCRTPEECFQAGWDDAADHPPLTPAQIANLTALWRPYLRRDDAA